ncbi:MAG: pyridoxal-dependent decarboxylase [Actinomycetota bacterium]|nr:pyridoxal-dependent decarboxylase [Actinomycetota bacterium]
MDSHPRKDLPALEETLDFVRLAAGDYLEGLSESPVRTPEAETAAKSLGGPLPEDGDGALTAVTELTDAGRAGAIRSAGPRFFHFVVGGATPAGLGGDWLTSVLDQNVGLWAGSPFGAEVETIALDWLKDLFELPSEWGGVLVTGATMANFVGLACARRWWALEQGVDVDDEGLHGLGPLPVFSSGYIHASATKSLGMLGMGRKRMRIVSRDDRGRLDLEALESGLASLGGAPSILLANAGEVNAGDFDPVPQMIELASKHNAWVHVDGAFGLFSRLVPEARRLTDGIEGAHSVISDGHKWLNVPHDCGFAFVRDASLLPGVFGTSAAYYVGGGEAQPNFALLGPESSRRARALAVWSTLRAYGRNGYRAMVEGHLALARRLAAQVAEADDLELLADVTLNIVCFRYRPPGMAEAELDDLNRRLGEAVLEDGRVYFGTTSFEGKVAFRPAIVNYRTTEADIDLLVNVVRELGAEAVATA